MRRPSTALRIAIAAWLSEAKVSETSKVSRDRTAFRLYADVGGAIFIRPDGNVYWRRDSRRSPAGRARVGDRGASSGAREYPGLTELLPERPPTATDCDFCVGVGRVHGIICGECSGLGWRPAA
jgi:hypothetical protein